MGWPKSKHNRAWRRMMARRGYRISQRKVRKMPRKMNKAIEEFFVDAFTKKLAEHRWWVELMADETARQIGISHRIRGA